MKCPYCDETTHVGAKFCSKCGLPLSDDRTVVGTYLSDDTGPSPWVFAGGAGLLVVLVLILGWLGNRPSGPARQETVRRQPIGGGFGLQAGHMAPGMPAPTAFSQFAPAPAASVGPSVNYTPSVRWAWVPPAASPAAPAFLPEPQAPRVLLAANPLRLLPRAVAQPPRRTQPEAPELPAELLAAPVVENLPPAPGPVVSADPSSPDYRGPAGLIPVAGGTAAEEASPWIWDPVHERWAWRPDWRRRLNRMQQRGGGSPASPAAPAPVLRMEGDAPGGNPALPAG